MVIYIKAGDIFKVDGVTSYAHGCNCAGAMGKGIAVQFKTKYPEMYKTYKQMCKTGTYQPGYVYDFDYGKGHVYNLGTQKNWRTKAEIEFIRMSLENMMLQAENKKVKAIALPAIGAGLGGLDWNDVKKEIEYISKKYPNIDLYVVESYKP